MLISGVLYELFIFASIVISLGVGICGFFWGFGNVFSIRRKWYHFIAILYGLSAILFAYKLAKYLWDLSN